MISEKEASVRKHRKHRQLIRGTRWKIRAFFPPATALARLVGLLELPVPYPAGSFFPLDFASGA